MSSLLVAGYSIPRAVFTMICDHHLFFPGASMVGDVMLRLQNMVLWVSCITLDWRILNPVPKVFQLESDALVEFRERARTFDAGTSD